MIAKAKGRFVRIAPRKMRLVARMIKGLDVPQAQALLASLPKAACAPLSKILKSAVSNATRDGSWTDGQLMISHVSADEGPMMKRYRSAPMGRASQIHKKSCHVTIELDAKAR